MEGGYLPWKNRSKEVVDELEVLGKPLPPPPVGMCWLKISDGSWQLRENERPQHPSLGIQNTAVADDPMVVEHTVMPDDTLQGICLRYNVSVTEVRRINLFSGSSIQCKKSLLIPVRRGVSYNIMMQQYDSKEVVLQKFRNATGEAVAEARIYLEEHSWDLDTSIAAWKTDENWEGNNRLEQARQREECIAGAGTVVNTCNCPESAVAIDSAGDPVFPRAIAAAVVVDPVSSAHCASPIAIGHARVVAPAVVIEMTTALPS